MTRTRPLTPTHVPSGGAEGGRDPVEGRGGELAEASGLGHRAQRAGVLGEEQVGGGGVTLGDELGGQLAAVAGAELDLDAGLLGELVEDPLDEGLVAAAVERERLGAGAPEPLVLQAESTRAAATPMATIASRGRKGGRMGLLGRVQVLLRSTSGGVR